MSGENPEPLGNGHFVHVPYNTTLPHRRRFHHRRGDLRQLLGAPGRTARRRGIWRSGNTATPARALAEAAIDARLDDLFATQNTAYWVERLRPARVPCAPVNRFSEALADPQVLHRGMVVRFRTSRVVLSVRRRHLIAVVRRRR